MKLNIKGERDKQLRSAFIGLVVFAQITSAPAKDVLARFIRTVGDRIAAGEEYAADYDDDNGYAFIVLRTSRPH